MVDAVAEPPRGLLEPERRKSPWAKYLGISSPLKGGTRVGRSPTRGMDVCDISLIKL